MKRVSVAAGLARGFVDFATSCGADRACLLADAGVTEDRLVNQDASIPVEAYKRLISGAKIQTTDPALPLRLAIQTRFETISIVGLIVHSSASVVDAFAQLNLYGNGEVWIIDNRPDPNDFPELTETGFGWFVGEFRRHFPDRKFALAMDVTHPEPPHAALCQEIYDLPLRFGAAKNGLKTNPEWLTQKFEDTNAYVFGVFADKADALMAAHEAEKHCAHELRAFCFPGCIAATSPPRASRPDWP